MQKSQPSLFGRADTMFGICQALGEDFGVSPTWFRIAFASAVIFNMEAAIGAYAAVGLLVLLTRVLHPSPRKAVAADADEAPKMAAVEATEPAADVQDAPAMAVAA